MEDFAETTPNAPAQALVDPALEKSSEPMLSPAEARVLACLLEKEITTPDYYPMTLNGLVTACNQRSNRSPITEWDDHVVEDALGGLRRKRLAVMLREANARVPKYKHLVPDVLDQLKSSTRAVLTELMLRGVQTLGELRTNSERMHRFPELADTESAVQQLMNYPTGPLVREIPPGGGKRVKTYVHLLCGEPEIVRTTAEASLAMVVDVPPPADWKLEMENRVHGLEERVQKLEKLLQELGG